MNDLSISLGLGSQTLRADFKAQLERRLGPLAQNIDWDNLPETATRELQRLQGAAESFEAMFLKDLIGKMRTGLGGTSSTGGYDALARETMDQAIAENVARTRGGLGIASSLFIGVATPIVRQAALQTTPEENKQP